MDSSYAEQHAFAEFSFAETELSADIYHRLMAVYREYYLGQTAVNKWRKSVDERQISLLDLSRPGCKQYRQQLIYCCY
ncbi:hypothetical protein NPIL_544401 [Nephila pilipes]|uniref:Uncharacterized protein n=1 Tax=Nephila pilipes TaxID=299642 RepID=A0A8X6PNE8_NEPPI|nr:hypothetical protein NPIL_544401 [Nephila pilipes]